jgi:hypothetical protein
MGRIIDRGCPYCKAKPKRPCMSYLRAEMQGYHIERRIRQIKGRGKP